MDPRPIGIFDSGVGGLTVARAVIDLLPHESVIYFGDTARFPYGPRSQAQVRRFAEEIMDLLVAEDVKLAVVACNSASAAAFDELRAALSDKGGKRITIEYVRDGERRSTTVVAASQDGRGFLGFQPTEETRRIGVLAAIPESVELFWRTTVDTVKGLGGFVTGLADRMSGPQAAPSGGGGGGAVSGQPAMPREWSVSVRKSF